MKLSRRRFFALARPARASATDVTHLERTDGDHEKRSAEVLAQALTATSFHITDPN